MRVADLEGAVLDYWVGKSEGNQELRIYQNRCEMRIHPDFEFMPFHPSTSWAVGGPIIERDQIFLQPPTDGHYIAGPSHGWFECDHWRATVSARIRTLPPKNDREEALNVRGVGRGAGETPLVAAMRAKVASHYGEEVPDSID